MLGVNLPRGDCGVGIVGMTGVVMIASSLTLALLIAFATLGVGVRVIFEDLEGVGAVCLALHLNTSFAFARVHPKTFLTSTHGSLFGS